MKTAEVSLDTLLKGSSYRYALGDMLIFESSDFSLEVDFCPYPSDDVEEIGYRGHVFFTKPLTNRLARSNIKDPGWYRIKWEDFEAFYDSLELGEAINTMAAQKSVDCFTAIMLADDFKRELFSVIEQASARAWAKEVMVSSMNSEELAPCPDYAGLEKLLLQYKR